VQVWNEHADDDTHDIRAGTEDSDTDESEWCPSATADLARESVSPVDQNQRVSKYTSNIRDEKGFSFMGKRESVKVFGLALHRPGFIVDPRDEGHALGAPQRPDGLEYVVSPYESSCHLCGQVVDDPASNSLCCSNQAFVVCQKIYCLQCFLLRNGADEAKFVQLRNSETWICFHCRSSCPEDAGCGSSRSREAIMLKRMFRMCWAAPVPMAYNSFPVAIDLYRRKSDGLYEMFWRRVAGRRMVVNGRTTWMFDDLLLCGSYRCRLVLNGVWYASCAIDVQPAQGVVKEESARTSAVGWDAVRKSRQCGKPRIIWEAFPGLPSEGKELEELDVPLSLQAGPIRRASRTDGYDWRAAKLYRTMKWAAVICGEAAMRRKTSHPSLLLGVCADSSVCCIYSVGHRTGVGMTLAASDKRRIWERYDEMMEHSLWVIVMGRSSIHGIGLFTIAEYKKGDFVIEYAGELIRTPVADIREAKYELSGFRGSTYLFKVNEEYIVDATMKSNRARFINHSCDPNMEAVVVSVRERDLVVLVATRRIPPYAELTFNYQLPLEETKVTCLCRSWRCLGVIN
jgi:hypothetical protein